MVLGEAVFSLGLTPSKTSALLLANLDSLAYYAATTVSAVRGANGSAPKGMEKRLTVALQTAKRRG